MSFTKKIARKKTVEIIDESKPTLCAPIRVSDINYNNINISNQEAVSRLSDIKDLLPVIESAFKTTDSIIQGDVLAKFEETIQLNLKRRGFDIKSGATCIYQLLNSVNIYLVTHTLCGDKTSDEREIPSDKVRSINLDKKELHDNIANKKFKEANERVELNNAVRLGCYIRDTKRYFAGEGFIQAKASSIHSFKDVSEHCSIFLWVDHIYDISKKNDNPSFEALFTFVLLHELMHLMMDVFDETKFGIYGAGNLKNLGQLYGYFREESLANALALYLCDATRNDALVYSILGHFVQNQTTPYQTGLLYIEKDLLKKAVTNWMKCKKDKCLTKELAKEWLLEVTTESPRQSELIRIEDAIATLVP